MMAASSFRIIPHLLLLKDRISKSLGAASVSDHETSSRVHMTTHLSTAKSSSDEGEVMASASTEVRRMECPILVLAQIGNPTSITWSTAAWSVSIQMED